VSNELPTIYIARTEVLIALDHSMFYLYIEMGRWFFFLLLCGTTHCQKNVHAHNLIRLTHAAMSEISYQIPPLQLFGASKRDNTFVGDNAFG